MIEIEIPKDINRYEAKLVAGLTTRQTAFLAMACGVGIPLYSILEKASIPSDARILIMIIAVLPFLAMGWVKPYGMAFEKFIQSAFASHVLSPPKRKYITMNYYEVLRDENFSYETVQKTMRYNVKEREKEMKKKIDSSVDYMC